MLEDATAGHESGSYLIRLLHDLMSTYHTGHMVFYLGQWIELLRALKANL